MINGRHGACRPLACRFIPAARACPSARNLPPRMVKRRVCCIWLMNWKKRGLGLTAGRRFQPKDWPKWLADLIAEIGLGHIKQHGASRARAAIGQHGLGCAVDNLGKLAGIIIAQRAADDGLINHRHILRLGNRL